jgi:hypothetical protein
MTWLLANNQHCKEFQSAHAELHGHLQLLLKSASTIQLAVASMLTLER